MQRSSGDPPGLRAQRAYAHARKREAMCIRDATPTRARTSHTGETKGGRDEGGGGQRGVITDDCPLLRHGQSTARNPVHSPGSRGAMIRRRSAMRLDRAAGRAAMRERCACVREREQGRTCVSPKSAGDTRTTRSGPRLRGRSLRGSGRFSRREVNDCLVMPPEMADN